MTTTHTAGTTTTFSGSAYATPAQCLTAACQEWLTGGGINSPDDVRGLLVDPYACAADMIVDEWLACTDFSFEDVEACMHRLAADKTWLANGMLSDREGFVQGVVEVQTYMDGTVRIGSTAYCARSLRDEVIDGQRTLTGPGGWTVTLD